MSFQIEHPHFSNPKAFASGIGQPNLESLFQEINGAFVTPEHINDSPQTAPSKRVLELVKGYEKPTMGSLAAIEIGLRTIRSECELFDSWLTQLECLQSN